MFLKTWQDICRWRMLRWCEHKGLGYTVGLAMNSRLNQLAEPWMDETARAFRAHGEKLRLFGDLGYAAKTWNREHPGIARLEHGARAETRATS